MRLLLAATAGILAAAPPNTVFLEDLTWTEVRDLVKAGNTSIIVPTGGTEQNGPHIILGKHNYRIRHTAERIARTLGNTLVAPVVSYVPEGEVNPPTGHMRYAGTITLPEEFFRKLLEYAARSLRQHGFRDILFLGDSGPNQPGQKAVAEMLNREWASSDARVHHLASYYRNEDYMKYLLGQRETKEAIGTHAGIQDTSTILAVDPRHVRKDKLANNGGFEGSGVAGDPTRASVAYGRKGLDLMVASAVAEARSLIKSSRSK
jgi:creatinine amidohydrolase/Fe(II)-dependent formamide hydrolase-like protein